MYFPLILLIVLLFKVGEKYNLVEFTLNEIKRFNDFLFLRDKFLGRNIVFSCVTEGFIETIAESYPEYFKYDKEKDKIICLQKLNDKYFFNRYFIYSYDNRKYIIDNYYKRTKDFIENYIII